MAHKNLKSIDKNHLLLQEKSRLKKTLQHLILVLAYLEISGNSKNTKKNEANLEVQSIQAKYHYWNLIKLVVIKKELAIIKIDAITNNKLYLSLKYPSHFCTSYKRRN